MGKYTKLVGEIIEHVGGEKNISSLTHCITRLRFKLRDEALANDDVLKNTDGVVTVMKSGGQYQVVIGQHVGEVYEEANNQLGISLGSGDADEKVGLFEIIAGCFQPFLGALAASGLIKGLNALFLFLNLYPNTSGTYLMLNGIGDAIFYFMPIAVAITAARKFKVHEFTALALGASLLYPALQQSALGESEVLFTLFKGGMFESPIHTTFLGIPLIGQNYASSVVPIIFVIWLASIVQKFARKIVPEMLQSFIVPAIVLMVTMPIAFLFVGPVISFLTDILASGFSGLLSFSPILFGLILGIAWQVMVIFGLHWAIIPMMMIQIGEMGNSPITGVIAALCFTQIGVMLALLRKVQDKETKAMILPAIVSGIAGVTEPAIYGITLPRRKAF
ncbi:MAG: PTS transporter subunit EIIC, partial [Streptococcaceae bacterium]|nr:PTS transporter subunit EIIC [Streptococcaceae bacterium]